MAKLYVFGIGGTGSRVLKSLTMLLASGVKLQNGFDTVVPLIIDPDAANGDLNRTADILTKYQNIYKAVGENNEMFGTKILTLKQLVDENLPKVSYHFCPVFVIPNLKWSDTLGKFSSTNCLSVKILVTL